MKMAQVEFLFLSLCPTEFRHKNCK